MVLVYCTSSQHTKSLKVASAKPRPVLELCPEQENLIKENN